MKKKKLINHSFCNLIKNIGVVFLDFKLSSNDFIKICPNCKGSNIKKRLPQINSSWFCLNCGNMDFVPIEAMRKKLK